MNQNNLILKELQRRAAEAQKASATLRFKIEDFCFPEQLAFALERKIIKTAVTSRRAGKCLKKGTIVLTSEGPVVIEDVKIGAIVYGYNEDGSISETKVIDNVYKGIKQVFDIKRGNKVLVSATKEHPFIYSDKNGREFVSSFEKLSNLSQRFIVTKKTKLFGNCGKEEPFAYALGAFLGDGCNREHWVSISSNDVEVVDKVAQVCGSAKKNSAFNFTHSFKHIKYSEIPNSNWIENKYCHEKFCDFETISKWSRYSQYEFLAGLIDTDGCVRSGNNRLDISISMQALAVLEVCKKLMQILFQITPIIIEDSRDKYKNGSVYTLRICNNIDSKYVLSELSEHIVCARKKYKPEYDSYSSKNKAEGKYGVSRISKTYLAECYDLEVDNSTHLYMIEHGIITHNTNAIIADFAHTCLTENGVLCLYLTLTSRSARAIIWDELKKVADRYSWNVKTNEVTLEMFFFDTKSTIRCGGAKDESEIEKYRGLKVRKAYIDEAQSFRPYLRILINDILLPSLRDLNGELGLTGTPGPVPAGPFYEYCNMPNIPNHHWNAFNNPHMHNPEGKFNLPLRDLHTRLKQERELKGITEADPSYQRETYGKWVEDKDSLVYKFHKVNNVFHSMPQGRMIHIFGIDIGWNDSDAIAVLAYNFKDQTVYLVEEHIQDKQTITELVKKVEELRLKYNPVKLVMDAGALGKKIQEEIRQRHGLNLEAAEKHRKNEFIELLNDDLRTNKLKCYEGSRFEQDTSLVVWDRSDPIKPKISDVYHTDIGDAVLYAWRECKHFITTIDEPVLAKNTQAYMDKLEEKEAEAMMRKVETDDDIVEQDELDFIWSEDAGNGGFGGDDDNW